ncbi:MAG: hypothetical protein KJ066_16270 [Acidobacteria bacterium]|nr:hypothetical protein [Acidobacteriota bacterium]
MMTHPPRSSALAFFGRLRWLDGSPLVLEPYRARLFAQALDDVDEAGRPRVNLVLAGRGKKNAKTLDLVLAAVFCLVSDSPAGHDSECYVLANDGDQARDDLTLAKKLLKANPVLGEWLRVKRDVIERKDGRGFLEILPANDVVGSHGKTYRFCGYDEIHGYRTWDIFEAMQPDPHRWDALQWITSYASLFHRPGVPLFDLMQQGKAGTDPRMLFSWYAADFTTDPAFADKSPEDRANPSMAAWKNPGYLAQQRRRLPAHKYRRLHLNLPGQPAGSAYQPEPVMDAVDRGVRLRAPEAGVGYVAFVDMSGGSRDDAVLAVAHRDVDERVVVDRIVNQGAAAPFDPRRAVERFVPVLQVYGVRRVQGDKYAGETFRCDFERRDIGYDVCPVSKSELYEALEPRLNSRGVILLDEPLIEQQLLGLVWRGGRIDHPSGEHDDYANAVAGVVELAATRHVVNIDLLFAGDREPVDDEPWRAALSSFPGPRF